MTQAEKLVRALGQKNVARLLEVVVDPRGRTVEFALLLGPVRGGGRRSVELVTSERTKTLDEGEVEAYTPTA